MATLTLQRMLGIGLALTGLMLLFLAAGPDGGDVVTQSPTPTSLSSSVDLGSVGGGSANGPTPPGAGSGDAGAAASLARQHTRELEARVSTLEAENARLRAAVTKAEGNSGHDQAIASPPGLGLKSAGKLSNPAHDLVDAQLALAIRRSTSVVADDAVSPVSFWAARDAKYSSAEAGRQTFRQISDRMRDDKSFRHRYDVAYTLYLEHLRSHSEALSMFEIGLGCDQERIGASVMMWGEYLPKARLTLFEYDEPCGKAWAAKHRDLAPKGGFNIFFGDQANADHLNAALKGDGDRLYDIIIDDGGHSMQQQITSFKVLWPKVKRGGVYVVEDLNSSFKTRYGGVRRPAGGGKDGGYAPTMTNFLKDLTDQLHAVPVPHHQGKYIEDTDFKSPIARVDCHHFICFITKR